MTAGQGGSEAELLAAVDAVASVLQRLGIVYFITGSFASSIQGQYRATNDVDLVADIERDDLDALIADLSADFVADIDQARAAVASGSSFNLIHRASYLKVDIFPCLTEFDHEAANRAESITVIGAHTPFRVASTEDVLLAKLRWYRLGGEESEVQRRDVRSLIAINRTELDLGYLNRWAATLGVDDLLRGFLG